MQQIHQVHFVTNPLDTQVISFFNHFARRSWAFDTFVVLCSSYLLRAAGIVPLYWWAWFRNDEKKSDKQEILLFGMISCVFALFLSRLLSSLLPFRTRPIHDPSLHFVVPYEQGTQVLLKWSSFPSDHAAVYFTLAACLCFVSRRLGAIAVCWAFFVTCLPRIYLGLHFPSDIIAGALLGVGVAYLSQNKPIRGSVTRPLLKWQEHHPGPFYAALFLFSIQLATAFESVLLVKDYILAVSEHVRKLAQ